MALTDGYYSLGANINKVSSGDEAERDITALLPELRLDMSDEELLVLKQKWEKAWSQVEGDLAKRRKRTEDYWEGKHFASSQDQMRDGVPYADNIIFEALETFLPIATRQNPEPVVDGDNTEEGQKVAFATQKMLARVADEQSLKMKVKDAVRNWALYFVGVLKVGFSSLENDLTIASLRPQKLVLDPEGTITVQGRYTGDFIGEVRKEVAYSLIRKFPGKKKYIEDYVHGMLGTMVPYMEWWTNDYVFWTLGEEVLDKQKNPHWNYPEEKGIKDEFGNPVLDEQGQARMEALPEKNHLPYPQFPYFFLSMYSLGKRPFDVTSLIEQNISNQDMINKRVRQIDKNADNANNGLAVSGDFFTKEEAAQVAAALRNGGAVWVPRGPASGGVAKIQADALPNFIYQNLSDMRSELRNIFGTLGSTPAGTQAEQTVRGKIIVQQQDASRVGGGITEYIEQLADSVYNYLVQLMYVYYDEPHVASVLGKDNAREIVELSKRELEQTKLLVSVKEGSLIPRDPLTKHNQAIDLWSAGAIDPLSFFSAIDHPNPKEAAERLIAWKTNPQGFLQEGQPQQSAPQEEQPQPPQSMPQEMPQQLLTPPPL